MNKKFILNERKIIKEGKEEEEERKLEGEEGWEIFVFVCVYGGGDNNIEDFL